jgi:hypothetical protein
LVQVYSLLIATATTEESVSKTLCEPFSQVNQEGLRTLFFI